jgi:hypothetical protein
MVTYSNSDQRQQEDSDRLVDQKLVAMPSVLFVAILFLLCLCSHLQSGTEEQEQDADDSRRGQQGYLPSNNTRSGHIFPPRRSEARVWDGAPSTVATAIEVAEAPKEAVSPPLVCTYRRADGW